MDDLGRAFSFPFRDSAWFSKFLIGSLFMLLCLLLVGFFILAGYFIRVTQAAMRRDENPLPDWNDIGGMLITGFKFVIVYLIYLIPILLLYVPLVVMAVVGEFSGSSASGEILTGMYAMAILLLIIPYGLALSLLMPVITYRFARNENIGEALDVGAIVRAFRKNWQGTLIVALIAIGIQSFSGVGIILFLVGVFFTIFYSYLVSAYLFGALGREDQQQGVVTV
jgi:hypothetical protein